MGNIGIYADMTLTQQASILPIEQFAHRHELECIYHVVDIPTEAPAKAGEEILSSDGWDDAALQNLIAQIRENYTESNVYLFVAPEQIPSVLNADNCKRIFLCSQDGCCSAENLNRMILLGCGPDYLPEYLLQSCVSAMGKECRGLSLAELKEKVMPLYDTKRIPHALGCCETAAQLAKRYGADTELAARAGILHDITKILTVPEQLRLCEKYGIMTDDYCGQMSKLLHAKTAAAIAEKIFDEPDDVCEAISWHTTGKADMTLLSKIIYIADYIEPNRRFEGVDELRTLSFTDLDAAVLCGVQMTIDTLQANHRPLNRYTLEARDFLKPEGTK